MSATHGREPLDDLLDQSGPRTTVMTDRVVDDITRLSVAAATAGSRAGRKRKWARPALAGLLTLTLLGGAAAAAATTAGLWAPWAETPVAAHAYALPSGAQCEARIGNVTGTDPAAIAIVENFYGSLDFPALLTEKKIDAAIAAIRSDDNFFMLPDGSSEPAGFGTNHYSADMEYNSAVSQILSEALAAEFDREGVSSGDANLSYETESHCPGADW